MMLDTKNSAMLEQQAAAPPAPPAYMGASSSSSEPLNSQPESQQLQPQWIPNANLPPNMVSLAQVGEQYRSAQFAKCAQGDHLRDRKFGVLGIITAVVLFPLGLVCLFIDSKKVCSRCGNKLYD